VEFSILFVVQNVDSLETHTNARTVILSGLEMSKVMLVNEANSMTKTQKILAQLRILPTGPEVDLDKLIETIKGFENEEIMVRGHTTQPIAFGLVAIKLTTIIEGAEGSKVLDLLEDKIREIESVSQVETEAVSLL